MNCNTFHLATARTINIEFKFTECFIGRTFIFGSTYIFYLTRTWHKIQFWEFFFYFGQMIYLKLQFFITFSLDTNRSNKKWTNAPVVNLRHSIVFMKFPLNGIANRMRVSHIIHNLFFSLSLSIHLFRLLWQQHFHWIFFFSKKKENLKVNLIYKWIEDDAAAIIHLGRLFVNITLKVVFR